MMGVRRFPEDVEELILLTSDEGGGINIYDAVNGQFSITFTQAQLLKLPPGTYVHSLIRVMGYPDKTFKYRMWSGTLTNAMGPTR